MKISINIYVNFINISLQETLPDFKKKKKTLHFIYMIPLILKKKKSLQEISQISLWVGGIISTSCNIFYVGFFYIYNSRRK